MKNKSLLIVAVTAMMGLGACGATGGDDPSGGGSGQIGGDSTSGGGGIIIPSSHKPAVVDQDLPTDDPSSPVNIVFWHCLGHEKTKNLQKVVDAYNAKYAGKYNLVLEHPAGEYSSLHDVVKTRLASGEVPALTMGYPDSFSEYMTSRLTDSFLLRLDNFLKDPNYGYTEAEIADFVPGYYNEGNNYQFTGTWSMPMYKSTEVVYYNYSYFMGVNPLNAAKFKNDSAFMRLYNAANGRTFENDDGTLQDDLEAVRDYAKANGGYTYTLPTTWDETITLARQMNADRKTMKITDRFYPFGYDSDANLLISQMAQRNIPYTVNDDASRSDPKKHFVFDNAQAKALVEEIVGYIKEKIMITKNSLGGTTYTNSFFNEGKCAFTVGSTGGSSYNISSNFAVKLAPVPYKGVQKYIQQGPSICFFNNENAYIHKGAWLFYKMFAEAEANAQVALENSYDPVRISSYETTAYQQWVAYEGQGLKYDIPAMTATLKQYYITSPVFIGSSTARNEIGNIIDYIINSEYSTTNAFKKALDNCYLAAKQLIGELK